MAAPSSDGACTVVMEKDGGLQRRSGEEGRQEGKGRRGVASCVMSTSQERSVVVGQGSGDIEAASSSPFALAAEVIAKFSRSFSPFRPVNGEIRSLV